MRLVAPRTDADRPKAVCAVCEQTVPLLKDGRMRGHQGRRREDAISNNPAFYCRGAFTTAHSKVSRLSVRSVLVGWWDGKVTCTVPENLAPSEARSVSVLLATAAKQAGV